MTAAVRRTSVAAATGLVVTLLVLLVPAVQFAYLSPSGHLVLETTVTLVAALTALLLYGRFRRDGAVRDLLLVYALVVLSLTALALVTAPRVLAPEEAQAAASWAALVLRLAGALLLAAAALAGPHRHHRPSHPMRDALVVLGVVLAVVVFVVVLSPRWPEVVAVQLPVENSSAPVLSGHPVAMATQVVNLLCYAVAAVVFTRRAARTGDELVGWLGAAAALGAWARVNYLLFPSLYTEYLYVGDLLRLGFYALMLVGVVREIQAYWRAQAAAAVESERRRLARDLHDGVVQELGYIRAQAWRWEAGGGPMVAHQIGSAAERALGEARRSITALVSDPDEGAADSVGRAVQEVGDRYDIPVELSLGEVAPLPPEHREALVRVAREAVSNAARHSGATAVRLSLLQGVMTVCDDGRGFDAAAGRAGGFGLTSMREHATAIGGVLDVASSTTGTQVTLRW